MSEKPKKYFIQPHDSIIGVRSTPAVLGGKPIECGKCRGQTTDRVAIGGWCPPCYERWKQTHRNNTARNLNQ